jgi:hypothetical protein
VNVLKTMASLAVALSTSLLLTACGGSPSSSKSSPAPGNQAQPLTMMSRSLPAATVGVGYNVPLTVSGGVPPYTWNLTSGTLPSLLSLIPSYIAGVPSQPGTSNFTIEVTDSTSATVAASFTLTVASSSALAARLQEAYSSTLTAGFGNPPYTWTCCASGSLAPGIGLSSDGLLSGKATAIGTYQFTAQATDSNHSTQNFSYTMTVGIGTDNYAGLTAAPVAGCTPTGYFQALKTNGRWLLADPLCNTFYQRSVYNADRSSLSAQVMSGRYGSSTSVWALHSLQRLQLYGFNSTDIFTSSYLFPIGTNGAPSGSVIQLPFVLYYPATIDVVSNPARLGLGEAVKSICGWQDDNGYHDLCQYTLDVFDPKWQAGNAAEMGIQLANYTNGFATSPWIIAISLGDAGNLNTLTGNGSAANGVPVYPHPAFIVATSNFTTTGFSDNTLHSKYAWVGYLENKYGSIGALNAAWNTAGFYTSFGDAGGFGSGSGVLDEDGRHTSWLGHDYLNLSGMNGNLAADLNTFLYQFARQAYSAQTNLIRPYDNNHLFVCGSYGGQGDGGVRPQVLLGMRDAGCQIFVLNWNSTYPAAALSANQAAYDATGVPAVIWYGSSAQADSDYRGSLNPGAFDADFTSQPVRGQHYAADQQAIFTAQGSNGDYYLMGTSFWSLTDNSGELTNWGLVSVMDNAYDGKCATVGASIDPFGFPCGGETASYGDYTDAVTTTNQEIFEALISP